jgi:hypothetical protein
MAPTLRQMILLDLDQACKTVSDTTLAIMSRSMYFLVIGLVWFFSAAVIVLALFIPP